MQPNDKNRVFDLVLKNALPYLILAPPEFRNEIAKKMDGLFHFFNGGESSIDTFMESSDAIIIMLKDAKGSFDSSTNRRISDFTNRYKSFDERIQEIEDVVIDLQRKVKDLPNLQKSSKEDSSPITKELEKRKRGRPRKYAALKPETVQNEMTDISLLTTYSSESSLSTTDSSESSLSTIGSSESSLSTIGSSLSKAPVLLEQIYKRKMVGKRIYVSKFEGHLPVLLNYIQEHGCITFKSISELFGFDNKQSTALINWLRKEEIIHREGNKNKKYTKYVLKNEI
jgi:hypothetical protein